MRRRQWVLAAGAAGATAAAGLAGCQRATPPELQGGWIGQTAERGHRLRDAQAWPEPAATRRAQVLVLGAGIAGLAAARGFRRRGIDDVHVLELEDEPGGNSRGHQLAGLACPLGAHYLPLPPPDAHEVREWLFEIGLLQQRLGRTVPDERHLCHSPQERLFVEGQWVEGLLPPAEPGSAAARQYRRFADAVAQFQRLGSRPFALPAHRSVPHADVLALANLTFAEWLLRHGFDAAPLRWYLDYCCRDDYGADSTQVSTWAGIHYFASRHGFHAPGDEGAERDAVFTWPEGNAWLVARLAAPLGERFHGGRVVHRVRPGKHEVEVLAFDVNAQRSERWLARQVVIALPLAVAARVVDPAPPALAAAAAATRYAPWLVAQLHLKQPLLERAQGAPASWDNVLHGGRTLGYVDATHQALQAQRGATVLTVYQALPLAERGALLQRPWQSWAQSIVDELQAAHPDLPRQLQRVELMRWGHAMAIPQPGLRQHPALQALRGAMPAGFSALRFAHADLAGYSVFEEAFTAGCEAAA